MESPEPEVLESELESASFCFFCFFPLPFFPSLFFFRFLLLDLVPFASPPPLGPLSPPEPLSPPVSLLSPSLL